MESVFLLWHVHEFSETKESDEKLIGVYRTEEDAKAAILRLADKPVLGRSRQAFKSHGMS